MPKAVTLSQMQSLGDSIKEKIIQVEENAVAPEYSLVKQQTPEIGFSSTYQLTKDEEPIGVKINIPQDQFLTEAGVATVETPNTPYRDAAVGDLYLLFEVSNDSGIQQSFYIPVKDFLTPYEGDDGILIQDSGISVKINSDSAHGLSVDSDGLALTLATNSKPGAMSAADKAKLDELEYATDDEVSAYINGLFSA